VSAITPVAPANGPYRLLWDSFLDVVGKERGFPTGLA